MRRSVLSFALSCLCLAGPAGAYEYGLQFTPNYGARGLVVAGYAFSGSTVIGNCSYYIVSSGGSGRGGGYHSHTTYYNQTCSWDLYGNLLSVIPGAPTAPTPLSTSSGLTVYARNTSNSVTGFDTTRNMGFVKTPSAQYTWTTLGGGYVFLSNQNPVDITLTLQNVGEYGLVIPTIEPVASLAKASLKSTTCENVRVKPGTSCSIIVTYDPRSLSPGDDPYTAYDTLTVNLVSNSGQAPDFSESIEVPVSPGG